MTEPEFEFAGEDASSPTATDKESAQHDGELPFEEALAKLEAIVAEMESGQLGLDASIQRFTEGSKLAQYCTKRLEDTEEKVEVLLKNSGQWAPFRGGASDADQ